MDPFNAFAETLSVCYDYVTLGLNFIGSGLGACSALAVSPITDLIGWPSKSFLHLVQSPFGIATICKSFPEMLHFCLEEFRIAPDCFGPMGKGTNDTIFGWEMMVTVPLLVLVHVHKFPTYSNGHLTIILFFTVVSRKGMAPSSSLFSIVNWMAGSTLFMCCRKLCLFSSFCMTKVSSTYWHQSLGGRQFLDPFAQSIPCKD